MSTMMSALLIASLGATVLAQAATSCNPFVTSTVKFDALPTMTSVPDGTGSVDWTNFQVEKADALLISPKSKSHVAIAPPFGAYISQANGDAYTYTEAFNLNGFYFGCVSLDYAYDGESFGPTTCEVQVVGQTYDRDIRIENLGTFSYPGSGNLTQVAGLAGGFANYLFFLVSGQGNAILVIDNVVIENFNPACPI